MFWWCDIYMSGCIDCFYCAKSGGNVYIVCKFFNQVINTHEKNGCPSYKSKGKKFGLKKRI